MKELKLLRDLPGFDDAMVRALAENDYRRSVGYESRPLELVGEICIPALNRISSWCFLDTLALHVLIDQMEEKRRIRLVPPPRPIAANDCEAPNA